MADYWKSQPRKFCQYCKCWIADNKPSVEFHERGKKHKENVTAKISEIKKKSLDKAKQEERMSKDFAAMEEAALKAYQEDLKRIEREEKGLDTPAQATAPAKPKPKPVVVIQGNYLSKKQLKHQKANKKPQNRTQAPVWVEGQTYDGNKYYYNSITGESKWEKPAGFQGGRSAPEQTESSSGCPWMEAVSPDGYTYYYNSQTGGSTWEKPADFTSSEASGSNVGGRSQEEPPPGTTRAEVLLRGEETPNGASASEKAKAPEDASQQCNVPKISFRKRKAEAEPSEKEGEDAARESAPKEDAEDTKKEVEVESKAAEPEEKKGVGVVQKKTQARRLKTANPYGAWEQIKEVVDPYASVDLQLPQFEGCSVSVPAELPPEPKPKFKERVITSLGEEGGATSFRRGKTQNGKSRRLRQRDDDEDD